MSIEWFRDLAITIFAFAAIGALIFFLTLSYSLYLRTKLLLDSMRKTSDTLQIISQSFSSRMNKVVQTISLVQGLAKGIEIFTDLITKIKKGGSDG